MLVDKYEVMWLGSQKSVRWFCLALIFLKKKKKTTSVFHLNYQTLSNPSFLFLYPPMAHLSPPFWQSSSLPCSHHHSLTLTSRILAPSLLCWPPFFWLLLGWWWFSEFPPQTQFFSYMCLLWKSHLLLQLQKQCSDLVINHKYTYWPLFFRVSNF